MVIKKKIKEILNGVELKDELVELKDGLSSFHREFRKHLSTFITGAFAFVAALLWRDAIKSLLDRYQEYLQSLMPVKEVWVTQFFTAFAVSIIAVLAIIIISKLLRVE
jgi:hypothetical protein